MYQNVVLRASRACSVVAASNLPFLKETPTQGLGVGIPQGIVAWGVEVTNQADEIVATYTILTLVKGLRGA